MGSSCCQPCRCVATGSRVRPTEQSSGQRSSSGREEMGCKSTSLAMHCDIAGPIAAKQRKNERKQSNGYSISIYCVPAGSSGTLEHSRALRLQGRRPLRLQERWEAGDWGGDRDEGFRWRSIPAKERMPRLRQQYQRSLGDRCWFRR
ncbi:hypothetical protein BHE74_00022468 [Ensete ventricosum]|nr:hypothetical protein GW17_00014245 [Ensete ventricosum]RWW69898.1 hypothetical protein BHE74_00022468 [Ensete ventricosum]